jgi:hypothetical protein
MDIDLPEVVAEVRAAFARSRIFSGLILMVMMRGAKLLTSPRADGRTSVILSRMVMRAV